jgi:dienelactone hydrolase
MTTPSVDAYDVRRDSFDTMMWAALATTRAGFAALLFVALSVGGAASQQRETISFESRQKGKPIQVTATIYWPAKPGPVPALVIHHGSGGISELHEGRYAREMVVMGVAGVVIDSFGPRGVTNTMQDQTAVPLVDYDFDALGALKALGGNSRIDRTKIGITGFSRGGTSALMASHERLVVAAGVAAGLRYALHVPFYPACVVQYYRPQTTGAPIYMLLGGADSSTGVEPCTTYAEALRSAGARIEVKVFPNALHAFDDEKPYVDSQGDNTSKCVFQQQADGTYSTPQGFTKIPAGADGWPASNPKAVSACITKGINMGPNAAAKVQSM